MKKSEKIDYDFLIGEVRKHGAVDEKERTITILLKTYVLLEPADLVTIQWLMQRNFNLIIHKTK